MVGSMAGKVDHLGLRHGPPLSMAAAQAFKVRLLVGSPER